MKFGFVIPIGDAPEQIRLASEIEKAGWDGAFLAELVYGLDPWVLLGAMAARTERIRLGTLLTPPARRRPWKLASEVATLDRLSGGRAVLSVGLGVLDTGLADVGEETDRAARAALTDETIDLLRKFWTGDVFQHEGPHYQVDWTRTWSAIKPLQLPGPPIWAVGLYPNERSMARAWRNDGVLPIRRSEDGTWNPVTANDIAAIRAEAIRRKGDLPFDIVIEGLTPNGDEAALQRVADCAEAGANWWVESMWMEPGGIEAVRERIAAGPPQIG